MRVRKSLQKQEEKQKDAMWIDMSSGEEDCQKRNKNKTFTVKKSDIQTRDEGNSRKATGKSRSICNEKKSYDEFLAEYFENLASEEEGEDNWERSEIPDILRDTQEIKISPPDEDSSVDTTAAPTDRRLQTIAEELDDDEDVVFLGSNSFNMSKDLNLTYEISKEDLITKILDEQSLRSLQSVGGSLNIDKGNETIEFELLEKRIGSNKGTETLEFELLEEKIQNEEKQQGKYYLD